MPNPNENNPNENELNETPNVFHNSLHIEGSYNFVAQGNINSPINVHLPQSKPKYFEEGYRIVHNISEKPLFHKVIARDNDLEQVRQMLLDNQQCVVVNGIGGIGKTTLSRYYIQQYGKKYKHIIWLNENKDAYEVFFSDYLLLDNLGIKEQVLDYINKNNKEQAINLVIQTLNQLSEPVLLIADNVQDLVGFQYITETLAKDKFHLLITSRQDKGDFPIYFLDALSPEDAKEMFCMYYFGNKPFKQAEKDKLKSDLNLDRILQKAAYHTLTVELLAKILRTSNVLTLESLADKLEQAVINPQLKQEIHSHYTKREIPIYETILSAFDISEILKKKMSFELLVQWAVLPSFYIPKDKVFTLFEVSENNADDFDVSLTPLIQNGWIQKNEEEGNSYFCHAIIQEAVRLQWKEIENEIDSSSNIQLPKGFFYNIIQRIKKVIGFSTDSSSKSSKSDKFNYNQLIKRLYLLLEIKAGDNPLLKEIWLPYSASILNLLTAETKMLAILSNNTAEIYKAIGNLPKSLEYGLKCLAIYEKVLSLEHPNLAASYNNIGETYRAMGDLSKSLEYGLKCLAIYEKVLSPKHINLATSYNNIAITYLAIGNLPKSLEYGLKSLAIREKIISPEHPSLAKSYGNIASTYQTMGDFNNAIKYRLKDLAISEKIFSSEHPDLATSYNNIALTYLDIGDLPKSLEYGLKSLAISEKIFSSEHPSLAVSYNSIANIYQSTGNLPKAFEYELKSMKIFEKSLPPEHPSLAITYNNFALTCKEMGDFTNSLEYGLKSIAIYKKVLSSEHPNLAGAYNNIANTYYHLEDYIKSLAYFQKAILILRKSLPKGHPNTKAAIDSMAVVLEAAIAAGQREKVAAYIAWYRGIIKV